MRFVVENYECYLINEPPCDGAYSGQLKYVQRPGVKDPANSAEPWHDTVKKWWYDTGTSHRVVDGYIERDMIENVWFVDVDTMDDLVKLIREYCPVLIDATVDPNIYKIMLGYSEPQ